MRARTLRSQKGGRLLGRPPGEGAKYLLTGLLTCGVCGGGFEALSRQHGRRRAFVYGCATHRRKGAIICPNSLVVPMDVADDTILSAIEATLLHPETVSRALEQATAAITRLRGADRRAQLDEELGTLDQAVGRLTAAIAAGGELGPLVEALRGQERRRQELRGTLEALSTPADAASPDVVRGRVSALLTDWRGLLRAHVAQGQQVLRRLIRGKFTFAPQEDKTYAFSAIGTVRPLLGGLVQKLASPAGFEPAFWP
ncbi:MAG: recombinase zinc beta ribbon domain-containing protein [Acidobacteria bacterium]|nr:recombinase zinc beta ribbon domain-containing protein [Acidobacteriota bacterium]